MTARPRYGRGYLSARIRPLRSANPQVTALPHLLRLNLALSQARWARAWPTCYQRLRLIERILRVSLDSAESRTSLQVALLTLKSVT